MGNKSRGFTIVELLIVIVIIAVLAAITIVAYNGIQNRAKTTASQTAAKTMAKKLEALNATTGAYPNFITVGTVTTQLAAQNESTLAGSGLTVAYTGITGANGTNTVLVKLCGTSAPASGTTATGYEVWGWDYTIATPGLVKMHSGGTGTLCSTSSSGN